jgi:bacterial/archaeal transporter family-2 protein
VKLLFFGLAILAGLSNPIQSAANAELNKTLGNAVVAASCVYTVAIVTLAVVASICGYPMRTSLAKAADVPWWGWVGGACGVMFVFAGALSTKQIGAGPFTVTTLVTAVVLSIVLDHFGLLGLEKHAASWPRLLGGALAIAGVVLVGRS